VAGDCQRGTTIFYGECAAGGANVVMTDSDGVPYFLTRNGFNYVFNLTCLIIQKVAPPLGTYTFRILQTAHDAAGLVLDGNQYLDILATGAPAAVTALSDVHRAVVAGGMELTGVASATVAVRYVVQVDWIESKSN
jgi:hypothetical protein